MSFLENSFIICPYCGENIEILVDYSEPEQDYIEDCEICCRPINISTHLLDDGRLSVHARHENEA